ncbi:hypothetical protein DOM22_01180 [Bdellovibrio sp. ZAP7]|uniref:hypothetical protein n=1 Tax=Bdellovibrio sp. ZAP7 TaxID=2231053 RepID=UPI001159A53B|nr:hypothetical protein [Bdellovibrio sp. ZAP7]QDK43871.1 hypothetical protein DOM22_01180 [Bdellovibrio sp. ZAP7]
MRRIENKYDLNYSFTSLKEFLEGKGWAFVQKDDGVFVVASPADKEGKKLRYLIPDDKSDNFMPVTLNLIEGIGAVDGTSALGIVDEFKTYLSNSLVAYQTSMKFKFGDKDFNVISLLESENLAKSTRAALAHSIDNEIKQATFRYKPSLKAIELSQEFQVGHQKGSFIYVVKSPLEPFQTSFDNVHTDLSLSSRGIVRIAKGMQWMTSAATEKLESLEELTIASAEGFNANIAECLSNVFKAVDTPERYFMFNINSGYAAKMKINQVSFKVENKDIENLERIHDILSKPREEVYVLSVSITKLNSENPKQISFSRKVTARIEGGERNFRNKKIEMELPIDLYMKALKAHEAGSQMTLTGKFQVIGNSIELMDLKSLA